MLLLQVSGALILIFALFSSIIQVAVNSDVMSIFHSVLFCEKIERKKQPYSSPKAPDPYPASPPPPVSPPLPSLPPPLSPPSVLLLDEPYTCDDTLVLTIHAYKKRRSFHPIPNRFEPRRQYHITWFVEFDYTLENIIGNEVYVWGKLEEVLPDNTEARTPRGIRQFEYSLGDDDATDIFPGSSYTASMKPIMLIEDTLEGKLFFKLDESMNMRTAAFCLCISSTKGGPYVGKPPLFVVDV